MERMRQQSKEPRNSTSIAELFTKVTSKNVIGYVPIYTSEQMIKTKANELTVKLNQPIFEIYESLNLFSQLLTKLYIENDHSAGGQARDAFTRYYPRL